MALLKDNKSRGLNPWRRFPFYNIFQEDDWFGDKLMSQGDMVPAMNVKEKEFTYEVELAAPGFSKSDFHITIKDHVLKISAEKRESFEESEESYKRKEFSYNSFERALSLPKNINEAGEIIATYEDGILNLSLQKASFDQEPNRVIDIE